MHTRHRLAAALLIVATAAMAAPPEPPPLALGADAIRRWAEWPQQRIGQRTYMRSTYDRTGGNEGADAGHFLYQLAEDQNVTLDVEGRGVLAFVRTNHWHGSPWRYEVDGTSHIVRESSTADPLRPVEGSTFLPAELFPKPLAWTWSDTRGADLSWTPVPFDRSFRLAYGRTHYGTGYYIYHLFAPGAPLTQPAHAWDGKTPPPADIVDLVGRAGSDLVPSPASPDGIRLGVRLKAGTVSLPPGETVRLAHLSTPGVVRALELSVPRESALAFARARLRITWDDRAEPSVDAPVSLFYGAGTLYNRDNREYLVKSFPMVIRFDERRVYLSCYFPMPFARTARVELIGAAERIPDVRWRLRFTPHDGDTAWQTYFHATYRDHPSPEIGRDLTLLDTRHTEGGGDWSGNFVGTSWIFSHRADLGTLEGDPRFYFDDSESPQAYGTGTEEWGGGGDYWGGRTMTLPFAGHPVGAPNRKEAHNDEDMIESAYRFLLSDAMPFGRNARITLEHGATNRSTEHYETVTYWYGAPSPALVRTDRFEVGDAASERAHAYHSPDASAPVSVTSRYEWGPDTVDGVEIFPATTKVGRTTTGTSTFTVRLRPDNWGVLLRRTLDYSYPNQRAEVWVADVDAAGRAGEYPRAGAWYLAGSNTCVYSNPRGELDPAQHIAQTSNRRFRDDEFLIGRDLTRGRKEIRVQVRFTPIERPLFPGHPIPPLAWSEMRYDAYCYVTPRFP